MTGEFTLSTLLKTISYQTIITGIGFAVSGAILHYQNPAVASALEGTAGAFMVLSVLFYRLSKHEPE